MFQFKSTKNILKKYDEDEVFNHNWFETPFLQLPETSKWDYSRELTIEDVDIWEVLYESGASIGVYAAWRPYAEFYLITTGPDFRNQWLGVKDGVTYNYHDKLWETYYGKNAQDKVLQRAKELNIFLPKTEQFVDTEDMWLFTN